MLVLTPRMEAMLARRARKAKRRRVGFRDRPAVVAAIIAVVREARDDGAPSAFTFEGFVIALLRSELCLRSAPWGEADELARDVMGEALRMMGAKRPSWAEGQPEWTEGGVIRETRVTCANCGGDLPEGHKLYCSKHCGDAARGRRYWRDLEKEERVRRYLERRRRDNAA